MFVTSVIFHCQEPTFDNLFFIDVTTEKWRSNPIRLQETVVITLPFTNIFRVPNRIIQLQAKLSFRGTRINQVCYSNLKDDASVIVKNNLFSYRTDYHSSHASHALELARKFGQARRCSNQY